MNLKSRPGAGGLDDVTFYSGIHEGANLRRAPGNRRSHLSLDDQLRLVKLGQHDNDVDEV